MLGKAQKVNKSYRRRMVTESVFEGEWEMDR